LGCAAAVSVVGATVAHAAPAGSKNLNYSGALSTSGQSMWGAGNAAPAADQTTSLFDQTWNASGGFNEETNVSFDPCFGVAGGCSIDFGTYGAKLDASTSGELGLSGTVHGASGGTVGVNYPVSFGLTGPADDSFAPGDTVTVSTTAPTVTSGASITSVYPDFSSVSLDGKFGFHAGASGEICVGGCASGSIFNIDLPSGANSVASGSILSINKADLLLIQGLGLAQCFGIAEGVLFGTATYPNEGNFCENTVSHQDNGYLAFPDVTLGNTAVGADNGLSAAGHDQYMVIPISAVAWVAKIAGLPFGFPNLSGSFNGTGVNYTTIQDILSAVVTQHQDMTFTPTVNLTLDFGQSLAYTVKDASNTLVDSGTGSTATFPLGDKISFAPPNALTVTPTLTMGGNTFTNHTFDTVAGTNQIQALALSASIGGCCDDVFPGIDINLGPLYDSGLQNIASNDIERANNSWTLGGFNAPQLAPFTISPDPVPVPTAKTVTPVEGASFTGVVASYVDPDPAAATESAADDTTAGINWGDGTATSTGTITGTGSGYDVTGTHTYAEEGSYVVTVTTTDTDTPTLHAVANSHANVSDAALTVTARPQLNTTEGAPSTAGTTVARFTDADPAGTASDYSATIDWGDGTSTSAGTVSAGSGGEFVVSAPTHTYAEEGTPTVTVTILDEGGASAVAHPPMTTADAALHSSGVTNGTQVGSNTPVLYWPGAGNAVIARLTDDDPLGTPSDYTAIVHWGDGTQSGATVTNHAGGGFDVTGSHAYTDANLGLHTITIDVTDEGGSTTETTTKVLAYSFAAGGTFAIGDRTLTSVAPSYSKAVTFWSSSWYKDDSLSGGSAPSAFKGFVNHPPTAPTPPAFLPAGATWTTATGSSSLPPLTVPSYMLALVTGKVTQTSSTVASGSVLHWVIIKTNAGYGPTAGHTGTATVVAVLN
jgi:hypothetical protein